MANKPIKKVWTPERFEVNIGDNEYVIEPQPIERIIEFDGVVKHLSDGLGNFGDKYYVTNGTGEDVVGPLGDEKEAQEFIRQRYPDLDDAELVVFFDENPDKRLDIRVDRVSMRTILESLVNTPYPALRVLIPDLREADIRATSLPQLKFIFDLLIQVNGVAWFERFVKNSLAPVLPEVTNLLLEAVKGATADSTGMNNKTNGEIA